MTVTTLGTREGRALVLGHDVNTDELHPSRFYSLDDEKVRRGFLQAVPGRQGADVDAGTIVVAGRNFGVGSSRETGARVFLLAGVRAIVAESYGRIFLRNVVNLGLPALTCPPGLSARVAEGDAIRLDLDAGVVRAGGATWPAAPLDPFHAAVLAAGGLAAYVGLAR